MSLTKQDLKSIKTVVSEIVSEEVNGLAVTTQDSFVAMDRKFASIDKRFESIDQRFEKVEDKLDYQNQKMEYGFNELSIKIDKVVTILPTLSEG